MSGGTRAAFIWHLGYWGPHVGFYGGVNYGYGYVGVGFVGGRWEGGSGSPAAGMASGADWTNGAPGASKFRGCCNAAAGSGNSSILFTVKPVALANAVRPLSSEMMVFT